MLNQRILGIIPARAGSKRLPGKNLLLLDDKPLIEWTIRAAKESACLEEIVVSSDDQLALQIARNCGVAAMERPSELASDTAKSVDVVTHVIHEYTASGKQYDAVMLLQPTSPLRTAEDIVAATKLFTESAASSVVSMSPAEHSPLLSCQLNSDRSLSDFYSMLRSIPSRAQDLPPYFRLNGAIYIAKIGLFLENKTFFCDPGLAYLMPAERSVDIDDDVDFISCQSLIQKNSAVRN